MRHRRANAQRNRNGRGMGDTPSWRQNTNAHCYSRALLVTLFFQRVGERRICVRLHPAAVLNCFFNHLLFALRPYSSRRIFQSIGKPAPNARQDGICNRKCSAAPFRRAHGISLKKPTITGHDKPWERVCPDIETADVHCFSRALLVALFCTAFVLRRGPSNLLSE